MRPDEKVRQGPLFGSSLTPIQRIGGGGERCCRPWQRRSQGFIDVQHGVQGADVRPWNQQLRVDDDVDVKRIALATYLQLLNGPAMPTTGLIDAIYPDVGIDKDAGASVVAGKTSGSPDAPVPWLVRRPG